MYCFVSVDISSLSWTTSDSQTMQKYISKCQVYAGIFKFLFDCIFIHGYQRMRSETNNTDSLIIIKVYICFMI